MHDPFAELFLFLCSFAKHLNVLTWNCKANLQTLIPDKKPFFPQELVRKM